jgi:hypothetical protein
MADWNDNLMLAFEQQAALFYQHVIVHAGKPIWTAYPGYPDPESIARTRVEQIATLAVPTGKIIACDPGYSASSVTAFTDMFPRGNWPFFLCGVMLTSSDNVAYWLPIGGFIRFHDSVPDHWRLALCPDQQLANLAEDEFWGFGVDSGRAGMMDAAALLSWQQLKHSPEYQTQKTGRVDYSPPRIENIPVPIPGGGAANVVSFQAGYGDGAYPCFIGETPDEGIGILMMVFDVFDIEANAEHPIDR